MPSITELRDTLIVLSPPPDDGRGRAVIDRLDELRVLRNVLDHQIAIHIALLDASGAAARAGSRAATTLSDDDRQVFETELLTQAFSGAAPAEIDDHARGIAMRVADADPDTVAAADDASLNTLHTRVSEEGRVAITADVTAVIGEKFLSMIDERSGPRPEPDGADDRRGVGERRADALELLLDQAAIGAAMTQAGAPRTQVLVTIPADGTDPARLPWVGAVTASTARRLSCDGGVAEIVLDDEGVPLRMGTTKRPFPHHLRQAIIVRDVCCVKCGAPAAHTQVHHIVHWADGGPTDLDNGCILCQRCHTQVHHHGWHVVM